MKKIIFCCILLCCLVVPVFSVDLSMSFGPWSFVTDDERFSEGLYPYAGLNVGWNDYLESEFFVIAEAAPQLLQNLYFGVGLGSSILGTRGLTYFNMYAQADFLYDLDFSGAEIVHNRIAGIRLSPLVIGNGYNGYRDRIFTMGVFYNFDSAKFAFSWNILIFDIFFKWP